MVVQSSKGLISEIDAILEIREPDGLSSEIIVEVKTNPVEPRLVSSLVSQLKRLSLSRYNELGQVGTIPVPMLVSTYLSPLTRERLTEAGISYADSTGNMRFTVDRPAVFVETQGADKNPFREERSLRSLKGGRAARVARGLMDYRPPFRNSGTSYGDCKFSSYDVEGVQSARAGRNCHQGGAKGTHSLSKLGGSGP